MIPIFLCLDRNYTVPTICLINSIYKLTKNCMFYVLVDTEDTYNHITHFLDSNNIKYLCKIFNDKTLTDNKINYYMGKMNFARFFVDEYFEIDDYIYIDTDMIVFGDISEIWNIYQANKNETQYFAGVLSEPVHFLIGAKTEFRSLYQNLNGFGFNAGIYITSTKLWEKNQIKEKLIDFTNNKKHHFKFGTQPILNVLFNGHVIPLPQTWNIYSFMNNSQLDVNLINLEMIKQDNIKLIHFTGPSEYKYWTLDNFKKYGMQSNGFELLNRFYTGKSKKIFYTNLNNNVIRYFYFYLNYDYKLEFLDDLSKFNPEKDLHILE